MGFGVFLVHPPMASVLLSASVERCFVSHVRDFSVMFLFLQIFLQNLSTQACGIGATIHIGQEMLCLPYAGFFTTHYCHKRLCDFFCEEVK